MPKWLFNLLGAILFIVVEAGLLIVAFKRQSVAVQLLYFAALLPSIILHELSHGVIAYWFGDNTAKDAGRLTLNPIPSIDPIGTVLLPAIMTVSGVGAFGWARPVPVNLTEIKSRDKRALVSLIGPMTNIGIALICGLIYKFLAAPNLTAWEISSLTSGSTSLFFVQPLWAQLILIAGFANIVLATFNLLPVPPLDGSALIERALGEKHLEAYYRFRSYSIVIVIVIVLLGRNLLSGLFNFEFNHWMSLIGFVG
ncbi:MAG: site-2 protease family protein [Acidimicrobiales bacterium]|nr:site-2 protease family protein [Acidimicrobiales bacterium]